MTDLERWRNQIEEQAKLVDKLPYSHNIISLLLNVIASKYGKEEANRAIGDFGLEDKGWHKVE